LESHFPDIFVICSIQSHFCGVSCWSWLVILKYNFWLQNWRSLHW